MNSLSDERGGRNAPSFLLVKLSCFDYLEFKHKSAKFALVVVSKSATTIATKMAKNTKKTRLIF